MKYVANRYMRFGGKDVKPGDELDPKDVANNKQYFLRQQIVLEVPDSYVAPEKRAVVTDDNSHELIQKAAKEALEVRAPKAKAPKQEALKTAPQVQPQAAQAAPVKRGKGAL